MLKPLKLQDTHVLSGFVVMVSMRKSPDGSLNELR